MKFSGTSAIIMYVIVYMTIVHVLLYRIRSLKKEIRHKIETADSAGRRRLEQRMKRDLKRTKRLGKHPYPSNHRKMPLYGHHL